MLIPWQYTMKLNMDNNLYLPSSVSIQPNSSIQIYQIVSEQLKLD